MQGRGEICPGGSVADFVADFIAPIIQGEMAVGVLLQKPPAPDFIRPLHPATVEFDRDQVGVFLPEFECDKVGFDCVRAAVFSVVF